MRKVSFMNKESSIKFHIKVRKPHFKLQKVLFKRGLERNCTNKNVLEFDVEKDTFFFMKKNLQKKISFSGGSEPQKIWIHREKYDGSASHDYARCLC